MLPTRLRKLGSTIGQSLALNSSQTLHLAPAPFRNRVGGEEAVGPHRTQTPELRRWVIFVLHEFIGVHDHPAILLY